MSIKFLRSSAAALALFAGGAAVAQQAQAPAAGAAPQQPQQQQQPQGPVKADLVPVQPEWTKVCGGDPQSQKEVCYTTRDFGLQADQPILALAVYDPKGAPEKVIRLLLPRTHPHGSLWELEVRGTADPVVADFGLCAWLFFDTAGPQM